MLNRLALIIVAPLFLVLAITLVSFVMNYQRNASVHNSKNSPNSPPPCGIAATTNVPESAFAGAAVPFSINITFSTCAKNLGYEWTVKDADSEISLQGQTARHIYQTPGIYRWAIKVSEGAIIRYQTNGQIEVKPATKPRLIAVLFSGYGNGPDDENGMMALLAEIENDSGTRWNQDVFAAVFTYDNQRRNGRSDPACQKLSTGDLDNPHRCALQWLSDLQPRPPDKLVFIGHSYGGNRARRMCFDIASEPWNHQIQVAGLITIDAINWGTCSLRDILDPNTFSPTGQITVECNSDCNQSAQVFDVPSTVIMQKSYVQTQGVYIDGARLFSPCLRGYGINTENVISCSSETHDTIDDNPAIHRDIRKFLTTMLSTTAAGFPNTSSPCPTSHQSSTTGQDVRATPGKFTEISVTPYCQNGAIKMLLKPQVACDFYAMAGNLIWHPNSAGVIDATIGSGGMNKPLRVWINTNASKPVAFDINYVMPPGCR